MAVKPFYNQIMKTTIYILFAVLGIGVQSGKAQQNALSYINNSYIESSNRLNTVGSINDLRNSIYQSQFGEIHPYQEDEVSNNSAYYKIFYKKNTPSMKEGALSIQCTGADLGDLDFDKSLDNYYRFIASDRDLSDYTKKVIKTATYNAGYFFNKKENDINILIYSKGKPGMVRATLEINLSSAGKVELAEDFISKTTFR